MRELPGEAAPNFQFAPAPDKKSALTEQEIFDRMLGSLRSAIDACVKLAQSPAAGPIYTKLRDDLKLIEGCCRQAAYWREDTRWLPIGMMMEEAHRRAGDWLRRHHPRPLFRKLGDNLRKLDRAVRDLKDKPAPKTGLILPEPQRLIRTQGRPIAVPADLQPSKPGLIIPT